jgi:hypothetical protein
MSTISVVQIRSALKFLLAAFTRRLECETRDVFKQITTILRASIFGELPSVPTLRDNLAD